MSETKVVEIGVDGMCKCSCGDPCPLDKVGMSLRCTEPELRKRGIQTVQKAWECAFCRKPLKEHKRIDTLHFRFGSVTLCKKCYRKQGNNVR